jgi:hypothetical protein
MILLSYQASEKNVNDAVSNMEINCLLNHVKVAMKSARFVWIIEETNKSKTLFEAI